MDPGRRRRTNLAMLTVLTATFVSGWFAFAAGSEVPAAITSITHGVLGLGLIALIPWKSVVIRTARPKHLGSFALLSLVAIALVSGFVQVFLGYGMFAGLTPIQVHVGAALVLVPFLVVHVLRNRLRQAPRREDFSRRTLLRAGGLLAASGVGYVVAEGAGRLAGSRSADRRETGSHELPAAEMPQTIWLTDEVPDLAAGDHGVQVDGRSYAARDLRAAAREPFVATLDCTNGWYARPSWRGASLADLIPAERRSAARSIVVTSVTGYNRTFPIGDADNLWLAFELEGEPLPAGHGGPIRLLAPGRRGFWWVKWVASVELRDTPWWLQLPFPPQ